jgi:hypothetical protein
MRRAAWIICGGVVYLVAMSALGRMMRDINSVQDVDKALNDRLDRLGRHDRLDQMLIASSRVKRRRADDGWDGR